MLVMVVSMAVWLAVMCCLLDWVTGSFARYEWPRYLAQCVVIADAVILFIITTLIVWNHIERKDHA